MSKAFKKVGKVFKSVTKAVTKTVKSVVKSKAFKVLAGAALVYFGGAGLMAMTNGGTFASGLSSAWTGLSTAGSAAMSGNFAQAGSALKTGFMGTAGQAASTAATSTDILGALNAPSSGIAKATATGVNIAGPADVVASLGANAPAAVPAAAQSSGLFNLGEMGTAALVSGGIQTVGSTIAGAAQDKAEKEARDRATYAGVNGVGGNGLNTGGLFDPIPMNSIAPSTAQWTPRNMDDLVRQYSRGA